MAAVPVFRHLRRIVPVDHRLRQLRHDRDHLGGPYWGLGDRGFAPFQGGTNVFTIADSLDMIRGKHDIRVGGQVRAQQMNVLTNAFQDGFFVFTNLWTGSPTNFVGWR